MRLRFFSFLSIVRIGEKYNLKLQYGEIRASSWQDCPNPRRDDLREEVLILGTDLWANYRQGLLDLGHWVDQY
jgi:hypothetical protein